MAGIWRDIELSWGGEIYTVRPTLDFLNYLESKDGCSLSKLLIRSMNQDLPSGLACDLIARTLQYAGASVRAEEVFAETGGVGRDVVTMAGIILTACLPAPKHPQPVAQGAPSAKKKPAATGRKSTG